MFNKYPEKEYQGEQFVTTNERPEIYIFIHFNGRMKA